MYAIRSYYVLKNGQLKHMPSLLLQLVQLVITSYSIHYTKLYEEEDKTLEIIMFSTLTVKGAEVSIKALQMGAADYIAKPTSTRDITCSKEYSNELITKIKALGAARRRKHGPKKKAFTAQMKAPVARTT